MCRLRLRHTECACYYFRSNHECGHFPQLQIGDALSFRESGESWQLRDLYIVYQQRVASLIVRNRTVLSPNDLERLRVGVRNASPRTGRPEIPVVGRSLGDLVTISEVRGVSRRRTLRRRISGGSRPRTSPQNPAARREHSSR